MKNVTGKQWLGIVVGLILLAMLLISCSSNDKSGQEESWKGAHTVSTEVIGAVDEADLAVVLRTVRNDDKAGFEAMLADGRIYSVPEGTKVDVFYMHDGIAEVTIESGSLIGKKLFIPYHILKN